MANVPSKKCKTLTEQYYDGTLPSGYYYFNNGHNIYPVEHHQTTQKLCVDGIKVMDKVQEYEEYVELLEKLDKLEKKLNKAEDAIKEAYWKCENCYKGVCQYCLNSGVRCYMQGNNVESVGKLKNKLDIAVKALDHCQGFDFVRQALKEIEEVK